MLGPFGGAGAGRDKPIARPVHGNIRAEIWTQMSNSLCWNWVAVPTGATLGAIADRPKIKIAAIVRRLMREAEAVANAPRRPATADGEMHGRRAGCT